MSIDFTATTIAGIKPPRFKYWFKNSNGHYVIKQDVIVPDTNGPVILKFIPDELIYTDVNREEKVIHFGWHVECEFNYNYITDDNFKDLIKIFTWRSGEINRHRIQCFPHNDFQFNFYGRFIAPLDFAYPGNKYIAHAAKFIFRSTEKIQDIPRISANNVVRRMVF